MQEYSNKQFELLLKEINKYDRWQFKNSGFYKDRDRIMISMAYYLGMRKAEIANAEVEFIDQANKTYTVTRHIAKNKKDRTIPIPNKFYQELISYIKKYRLIGYLFLSREKKHNHLLPRCVGRRFEIYRKLAKLEFLKDYSVDGKRLRTLRFHDLRSTYATRLDQAGIRLKVIQNLLGHIHLSSTERYLADSSLTERRQAVKSVFG